MAVTHDDPSFSGQHALSLIDAGSWRETMRLVDGARESVDGVAISRDGTIGAGSFNGTARLWDREGRPFDLLDCGRGAGERGRAAPNGSSGVAFSADGKRVAVLCTDGTLRLWNVTDGQLHLAGKTALRASFSAIAFSPDGRGVAWGTWDGLVAVTSAVDGETRRLGRHGKNVIQSIGFDAAGTTLVSSSRDGEVRIWNPTTGTLRKAIKVQSGLSVPAAVSPDGKLIVTGGPAGLCFWNAATGELLDRRRDVAGDQAVGALAFRPDGILLAVGGTRGIEILEVAAARRSVAEIASLGDTGTHAVVFTPRGDRLATGDVDGLRLWNLEEKIPSSVLVEKAPGVGSALDIVVDAGPHPARLVPAQGTSAVHAIDPTGRLVAVSDPQGGITIRGRTGARLTASDVGPIGVLAFSPDGASVAAAAESGKIEIIEPTTGKGRQLRSPPGADPVGAIAVGSKGAMVAVGTTRGAVEIWDAAAGQKIRSLQVSPGYPRAIAFSPNGKWLAVGMSQRGTLLFSLPNGTPSIRLSAAPGRDATFVELLSTGEVHASGADAQRFVACRAGRAVLPRAACNAR